ncbi:hypothetical protein B0H17DRAFT_948497 [Mycena rosella]|uniref:Uncharacterized protein n=1 Tax=Mycena rosella TaxID=1033263 RepID=A0AAD7CZ90_MYCRO|nr:hypothetical protein B0H17DRAFT_948497 [Mycena rosella]
MATPHAFQNGVAPIVTTRGPGKIHLISYGSNAGLENHVGTITTTNAGQTRFLISHSYTFTGFAFYWDGEGEAAWTLGDMLVRQPVGRSWAEASVVQWDGQLLAFTDVTTQVSSAVLRNDAVTCFIIPRRT